MIQASPLASTATPMPAKPRVNADARTGKGYQWLGMIPFIAIHLAMFGAIWSGVSWSVVIVAVVLYWVRMFAVTAGYHRYFSHRTYKTSRVFQFILAVLAQSSSQKGVLWWSAHHRHHHKYSDMPNDTHSPRQRGFWYAHMLWIYDHTDETDFAAVRDLTKYPELVWLNKYWMVPVVALGAIVTAIWGLPGLFIGFAASTVATWHCTFFINSLTHVFGRRRFQTTDDSRNSMLAALLTMGEGWHNNHHHYQSSTRQGFRWWEIDTTWYTLKALSWIGVVWDLREPPAALLVDAPRAAGVESPVATVATLMPLAPVADK